MEVRCLLGLQEVTLVKVENYLLLYYILLYNKFLIFSFFASCQSAEDIWKFLIFLLYFGTACEKTFELVLTTDFSFMSTDEGYYRWKMFPAFEGSADRCKGKSRVLTLLWTFNNDSFSDISLYDCPKKGILPEMLSTILAFLLVWW